MIRFTSILPAWYSCLVLCAGEPMMQPPQPRATELEGVGKNQPHPARRPVFAIGSHSLGTR